VSVGEPDTILGYPYGVDQGMPDFESTGGAQYKPVVFGDLSKFWIREIGWQEKQGANVYLVRLDERYAEYGQIAFVGFSRMDSGSIEYSAIRHLITASSS
jgi:HK97 family phage major capsid protein